MVRPWCVHSFCTSTCGSRRKCDQTGVHVSLTCPISVVGLKSLLPPRGQLAALELSLQLLLPRNGQQVWQAQDSLGGAAAACTESTSIVACRGCASQAKPPTQVAPTSMAASTSSTASQREGGAKSARTVLKLTTRVEVDIDVMFLLVPKKAKPRRVWGQRSSSEHCWQARSR